MAKSLHDTQRLSFDGAVDADGHILEPPDLWETDLDDAERSQAYTRAYNRWICEFCSGSDRLIATAHLSLSDPTAAAKELERAVKDGARGAYVAPFTHDAKPLGHPDNDPVFAAAQDLGVPFAIHPTFEPQWTKGTRFGSWENVKQLRLLASVTASDGVRHQFTTLFDYGVFDRFPRLKVIVLESGGGWIGYWLDRIDAVYGHTFIGTRGAAERCGGREGIVDADTRLSFAQLASEIDTAARALIATGVEPGERVAIWAPNLLEWAVAAFAVHSVGGVVIPINTRFKGDEAAYVLGASGASRLFTVTDFIDTDYVAL